MFARLCKLDRQHGIKPKSPETLKKSLVPNALYANLFLVWGFIYGMLDIVSFPVSRVLLATNVNR
jgi:hypothetical protein